jgi:hypothetical protein
MAAKAARRASWTYAIASYKFSMGLFTVHHRDMDPAYPNYHGVSRHPDDHVLLSHSILAAFDAIEGLGLAVPAGPGRPSRHGLDWNPEVLADLESRLRRAGIDPTETILWTVRGPARRIERRRPLPVGTTLPWSRGGVRDRRLTIPDAIGYCDFIRDKAAAHNPGDLTRSLTPYDVVNVQDVARYLLLTTMDFRVWEPPGRRRVRGRR